jgi:hypothetical protein
MKKFAPVPVSAATIGTLSKLVGRVVLAGDRTQYLYAPNSGKPCVYYRIKIEEERMETVTYWDEEGVGDNKRRVQRTRTEERWHQIIDTQHGVDFYLQDGNAKLFIPGGSRGDVQIESAWDSRGHSGAAFWDREPPPGVRALLGSRLDMQWMSSVSIMMTGNGRTGRMRFSECSFDVNELIAAMGVAYPATDPFTLQPVCALFAPDPRMLTSEMMDGMGWSDWDKKSWADLQRTPHVVLSDKREFTEGVPIHPLVDLPVYMTQPAQQFTPAMYAIPTAAPVPIAALPMDTAIPQFVPGQYGPGPQAMAMDRGYAPQQAPAVPVAQIVQPNQPILVPSAPAAPAHGT